MLRDNSTFDVIEKALKEGLLREPDLGAQIAVDVCRPLEKCMV